MRCARPARWRRCAASDCGRVPDAQAGRAAHDAAATRTTTTSWARSRAFLRERVARCEAAGIARERIVVDPGFGFGKTVEHNLDAAARPADDRGLGCPVARPACRASRCWAASPAGRRRRAARRQPRARLCSRCRAGRRYCASTTCSETGTHWRCWRAVHASSSHPASIIDDACDENISAPTACAARWASRRSRRSS